MTKAARILFVLAFAVAETWAWQAITRPSKVNIADPKITAKTLADAAKREAESSSFYSTYMTDTPYVSLAPTFLRLPNGIKIELQTGKVTIPVGVTLDEASKQFWDAIEQMGMVRSERACKAAVAERKAAEQ